MRLRSFVSLLMNVRWFLGSFDGENEVRHPIGQDSGLQMDVPGFLMLVVTERALCSLRGCICPWRVG